MNFFPGELIVSNGVYSVSVAGVSIGLHDDKQAILKQKGQAACEVTVGVRPEHIHVSTESVKDGIKAKMDVYEMMGSETHLHVIVDEKDVVVRVQNMDGASMFRQGVESDIWLTIPNTFMYVFDKETKQSLYI
jgi:multiple sugar transport system ATP-binding protein